MWLTDRNPIGTAFELYYSNLFSSSAPSLSSVLQALLHPQITPEINRQLEAPPSMEDIRKAIFSMGSRKSPSPA